MHHLFIAVKICEAFEAIAAAQDQRDQQRVLLQRHQHFQIQDHAQEKFRSVTLGFLYQ